MDFALVPFRAPETLPANVTLMPRIHVWDSSQSQWAHATMPGQAEYYTPGSLERRNGYLNNTETANYQHLDERRIVYAARVTCDQLHRLRLAGSAPGPIWLFGFGQGSATDGANFAKLTINGLQPSMDDLTRDQRDRFNGGAYPTSTLYPAAGTHYWRMWSRVYFTALRSMLDRYSLANWVAGRLDFRFDNETSVPAPEALSLAGSVQVGSWQYHLTDQRKNNYSILQASQDNLEASTLTTLVSRGDAPTPNQALSWDHATNAPFTRWWTGMAQDALARQMARTAYPAARNALGGLLRHVGNWNQVWAPDPNYPHGDTAAYANPPFNTRYRPGTYSCPPLYGMSTVYRVPPESVRSYRARVAAAQLAACKEIPIRPELAAVGEVHGGQGHATTADELADAIELSAQAGATFCSVYKSTRPPDSDPSGQAQWDADLNSTISVLESYA